MISLILPLSITCSSKPASFALPIIADTVIHLLQNGSEALPADQGDKTKLVGYSLELYADAIKEFITDYLHCERYAVFVYAFTLDLHNV